MMRDSRINRIFEGSSEIMHLFMAREAVDEHLRVTGPLLDRRAKPFQKFVAALHVLGFYFVWYLGLLLPRGLWRRFGEYGRLAPHVRFVDRACRRLARSIFHGMLVHGPSLERRQAFLFRLVDIAMDLFAMIATVVRARRMGETGTSCAPEATSLADLFCRTTRRQTQARFHALWSNDDAARYEAGLTVMSGRHAWLESGIIGLRQAASALVPVVPVAVGERSETRPIPGALRTDTAWDDEDEQRAAWEGMTVEKDGWSRHG
jgi:hypothetical protein